MILFKSLNLFLILIALGPAALGTDDKLGKLQSVLSAETNFAQMAMEHGTRDAFLANLADTGVVFDPGPVNGKRLWLKRKSSESRLMWEPIYADVSRAGDLGYTTGPWEFKKNASDPKPAAYGQFLSVWKRQPNRSWKVVLDGGIETPEPTSKPTAAQTPVSAVTTNATVDPKSARITLADAERKLNKESEKKAGAALISAASDSIRILRSENFPTIGKEAAVELIARSDPGAMIIRPSGGGMSRSGDLAYSYGEYTNKQSNRSEHGIYIRIWKQEPDADWKLVVESRVGHPEGQTKTKP